MRNANFSVKGDDLRTGKRLTAGYGGTGFIGLIQFWQADLPRSQMTTLLEILEKEIFESIMERALYRSTTTLCWRYPATCLYSYAYS